MRKILMILLIVFTLSGCADVEGYETDIGSLETRIEDLNTQLKEKESENKGITDELDKMGKKNNKLQNEYNAYKKRMKPYEDLEETEAEARKIEAEKIAEQKKVDEEKKRAEVEKKKQEEAAAKKAKEEEEEKARQAEIERGYETGITFNQLARNPDDYITKKIKFYGRVVQVIEGADEIQLRFAVDDDYDQVMYLGFDPEIIDQRVLEDDYLTIYGHSLGTISYESTLGSTITIPAAILDKIEFK